MRKYKVKNIDEPPFLHYTPVKENATDDDVMAEDKLPNMIEEGGVLYYSRQIDYQKDDKGKQVMKFIPIKQEVLERHIIVPKVVSTYNAAMEEYSAMQIKLKVLNEMLPRKKKHPESDEELKLDREIKETYAAILAGRLSLHQKAVYLDQNLPKARRAGKPMKMPGHGFVI